MKQFLLLLLCACALTGCLEDDCRDTVTYQSMVPIYVSPGEWRSAAFDFAPPEDICEPSSFYVYNDLLFVIDKNRGMHILDNSDNANPTALSFLTIPGGQGIAVRNNLLYVNQYTDLLTFDLRNPRKPDFLSRTEDVFSPHSIFGDGISASGAFITGYAPGTETREVSCNPQNQWFIEDDLIFFSSDVRSQAINSSFNLASGSGGQPEIVGTGGSLARFTITNGTLYAVDDHSLRTFSLADPVNPKFEGTNDLGWGIETVFPQGDLLFIGANNGMHIVSVANPNDPVYLSTFQHVRSCDPVVVQGELAYVTMWGGSNCGNQGDQLMVVDVSDPRRPRLLQETPMSNSHGLGIDGDRLFLASGQEGIRVFALDRDGLLGGELNRAPGFNARDVILLPRTRELIAFGWQQAGIQQYDYGTEGELTLKSHLSICD